MKSVSAIAHNNIALIKYWGKANLCNNLPATGSLSLTLDAFFTQTTLQEASEDRLVLNGEEQSGERLRRVQVFLDNLREMSSKKIHCAVLSENHVPTEGGLASSASGFAALAKAADKFFDLNLNPRALSELARLGSGSAARSIFPGLVWMHQEGYAEPLSNPLDLRLLVVSCSSEKKLLGSRDAMNLTAQTSPYYSAWLSSHSADLDNALQAIRSANLEQLGEAMEHSTLKMHASLLSAKPGFWYLKPLSIAVMDCVRGFRARGLQAYFTLDAGPHVKILCETQTSLLLQTELQKIPGILSIKEAGPGLGAYCL